VHAPRRSRRCFHSRAAIFAGALLLAGSAATGAEIEGVTFRDTLATEGVALQLHGVGLLRHRIVFRGYVAGLYLGDDVEPAAALGDVPKRLELEYFWSIKGEDFGDAADAILARNLESRLLDSLRPRIDALHAAYRDVSPGDRYALTYRPGHGTTLSWNDTSLATIPGADFARAYFAIWLGEAPMSESLRDALLAGR
jgi:hypothetical protein